MKQGDQEGRQRKEKRVGGKGGMRAHQSRRNQAEKLVERADSDEGLRQFEEEFTGEKEGEGGVPEGFIGGVTCGRGQGFGGEAIDGWQKRRARQGLLGRAR
jgi:hypothetical protein